MNIMQKFTARNEATGFTSGRPYFTADVLEIREGDAYSCIISDDRGVRHQINSDVPVLYSNGDRVEFDVNEVTDGNI